MTSFQFPLLKPRALVHYFKLLECEDITVAKLREPTPEFARKMYRICCLESRSCNQEELDVTCPNVAGLDKLMGEHDMHGHSLPLLALFRATCVASRARVVAPHARRCAPHETRLVRCATTTDWRVALPGARRSVAVRCSIIVLMSHALRPPPSPSPSPTPQRAAHGVLRLR